MATAAVEAARAGQADVLIDSLQVKKYEEIIDMLLAAGYFRARIAGLSQFDKIVGGLAWCITASNVDVDIDLFFEEEAQIKQKIELGESIEEALIRMKCPFPLAAYEIRGLNTQNIFPVIQWLVAKVIETRAETGDLLRLFSESQFAKDEYELPADTEFERKKPGMLSFVTEVNERYKPRRKFRRGSSKAAQTDEESRVQSVLLEYGYRGSMPSASDAADQAAAGGGDDVVGRGKKLFPDEAERKREAEQAAKEQQRKVEAAMALLVPEGEGISTNKLGSLVGENADLIREIMGEYAQKAEDMDLNEQQIQQYFGAELHKRQMDGREKQIQKERLRLDEVRKVHHELEAQFSALQEEYNKKVALNKRIEDEIAKLYALETPENKDVLQLLRGLVALNENLKTQEKDFRTSCKQQMEELQGKIASLQTENPEDEELRRIASIEEEYQAEVEKLQQLRQLLAKKNREIAMVQRKIDDIPSRTELQQYQRQFIELYEQISAKLIETKKYYNSYNTLNDTKQFLQKEVSILNSIDQNYAAAVSSAQNREKLLDSLKQIIVGVNQNVQRVEARLGEEKVKRDKLNADYLAAIEKEREYYKLTKDFFAECEKNKELLERLGE